MVSSVPACLRCLSYNYCVCIFIVKREMLLAEAPNIPQPANQNQAGADNPQEPGQFGIDDDGGDHVDEMDVDPHEISTSDFIILQSSFECKLLQYSIQTFVSRCIMSSPKCTVSLLKSL